MIYRLKKYFYDHLETPLFCFIYKHFLSRKYNCLASVVLWNRNTKWLNDIRWEEGNYPALFWQ